ncbi:MAG: hypothetical protein ACOY5Y_16150 [Pseudomonadota bacterium]|jgi:hypothetical protein
MKFACLAAAAAAALVAAPAAAADLLVSREPTPVVRISVVGKSDAQVTSEIQAAAAEVCRAETGACVQSAIRKANRQYSAIKRNREVAMTRVEVLPGDSASVRVAVAGRTLEQIHGDIELAAKSVCKAVGGADYRGCVEKAARSAKSQLREMTVAQGPGRLAAR